MAAWRVLREPTVPILLAASVAHVVRRNVIDFAVFFGTAVVIVVDARREQPRAGLSRRTEVRAPALDGGTDGRAARSVSAWLVLVGVTLFSAIVALAAPGSLRAQLVLVAIGLAAVVLVFARPQRLAGSRRDRRAARGWPVWAVIGVAACLWELTSFISQQVWRLDQDAHPAVSDLVGPLLQTWFGRAVFLLLWAGAGWWLLRQMIGTRRADGHDTIAQDAARSDSGRGSSEHSEPGRRHAGSPPPPGRADGHSEAGR